MKRKHVAAPDVSTRDRLIAAAAEAFSGDGYFGTDSNRIARRAGFAPQTFYRHFDDKLDVFLAVYAQWQVAEAAAVRAAVKGERAVDRRAAAAALVLVRFHKEWAVFRRSLRLLALEEPRVRAARAASRAGQMAVLRALPANSDRTDAELLSAILQVERLCDALADQETAPHGITEADWLREITQTVARARGERA